MIDNGEIMVSAMSRVEKELKNIGLKVMDSHIFRERGYGYIRGIPNDGEDKKEIDIAVEVTPIADNQNLWKTKTGFNLKERGYEINTSKGLGLQQDFYIIATPTHKEHKFYIYTRDEMSEIIEKGVLQNIIKSQLSKTANIHSTSILELDNFIKPENENKWSKLLQK